MSTAQKALEWAKGKVGCGYSQDLRNATNPDYFDCSSLVARAYKAAGYKMAQTVSAYEVNDPGFNLIWPASSGAIGQRFGTLAQIKKIGWIPTPGDLIFYCHNTDTPRKNKITHVAFVLDSKRILHARNPTLGVLINDITLYDGTICAVTRFEENTGKPSGAAIRILMTKTTGEVETMALEEYLRGVVPTEVSASWPAEALKAQAIAARTYALKRIESRKSKPYDIDDTSAYQSYNASKAHVNTDAAIKATAGIVLTYDKKTAEAVYCASNGGATVSAQERWGNSVPYLLGQPDPYDKHPKNGHGVGMSQRGAKARAEAGQTCEQILAFYYLGASVTRKA